MLPPDNKHWNSSAWHKNLPEELPLNTLYLVSENNPQTLLPAKPDLPQVPQASTQLLWFIHTKCILPSTLLFWYHSNPLKFNLSIMNFIFSRSIIVFSSSSSKGNSLSCMSQSLQQDRIQTFVPAHHNLVLSDCKHSALTASVSRILPRCIYATVFTKNCLYTNDMSVIHKHIGNTVRFLMFLKERVASYII